MKKQTTQRIGTYLSLSLSVGTGVLGATSADAFVVPYTGSPVTAVIGEKIWWNPNENSAENLSADNTPSLGGLNIFNAGTNYIYTLSTSGTPFGDSSLGTTGGSTLALFLTTDTIGPSTNWYPNTTYMAKPGSETPWTAGGQGYVAFSFGSVDSPHYGWADFTYNTDAQTLTLNGYAYESVAGDPIAAGATSSVTAVPEPSTLKLGFLVMGASGLVALRRRRKATGESLPTS